MSKNYGSKKYHKIEKRFSTFNITIFVVITIIMLILMSSTVNDITNKVSIDYARFYAIRAIDIIDTYVEREIELLEKAVNTDTIRDWFEDETNAEKKRLAYNELMKCVNELNSNNLYIVPEKTHNEYAIEGYTTYEQFESHAVLDRDLDIDKWYFEAKDSDRDYIANVDVDKKFQRKLVWINYKIKSANGEMIGLVTSGIKFENVVEDLFSGYNNEYMWGLVIDNNGIVQMDSAASGEGKALIFDSQRETSDYYNTEEFRGIMAEYLNNPEIIKRSSKEPVVYKLLKGKYRYVSIANIESMNWSVVTFYNSDSLFSISQLLPLIIIVLICLLIYVIANTLLSHYSVFKPFGQLANSISIKDKDSDENGKRELFGIEREDEIGDLARTIDEINKRLNQYNTELIKTANTAEEANYSKSVFLANMSHEIRTPLNTVLGMTQIIKDTEGTEHIIEYVDKIEGASKHLLVVVNDILDMSNIETGKLELQESKFEFNSMISNVVALYTPGIQKKNQKFQLNMDERIPRHIISDSKRISQVISNLLSNANKFTPEGGSITLSIYLQEENEGECVFLAEVIDTGIGISAEQLEQIFEPFEQVDFGISRQFSGAGLGLTIARSIIEMLGGEIFIESKVGRGTHFGFTFKAMRAETELDEITVTSLPKNNDKGIFEGYRLLVVDDIDINREIIGVILKNTGILVEYAENGGQAVKAIESSPNYYDIVFMDLQMPVMNGYAATRAIRQFKHASKLPIIAVTANVFSEDVERCLAAGMNAHLRKPIEMNEVIKVLQKYLLKSE